MIVDGATRWGDKGPKSAAHDFDLKARSAHIYEWVRQIRGGVLAGAFTIESHLNRAILHFVLGDRIHISEVVKAFDEGILSHMTFERRVTMVGLIAPHFLTQDEAKAFKADLSNLRTTRNAMAHNPFWFQPELNDRDEVINVVPVIMRGKAAVALTSDFTEQANLLISNLIQKSVDLSAKIKDQELPSTHQKNPKGSEPNSRE